MLLKKIFSLAIGSTTLGAAGALVSYLNKSDTHITLSEVKSEKVKTKDMQSLNKDLVGLGESLKSD